MIAFRIYVNQAPPFLAAVAHGITSAGVIIRRSQEGECAHETICDVGALDVESGVDLNWIKQKRLCLGDLVRIELVETEAADPAEEIRPVPKTDGRSGRANSDVPNWEAAEDIEMPRLNSDVLALEIAVNGRDAVLAGLEEGVSIAMVSFQSRSSRDPDRAGRCLLEVTGMDIPSAMHFSWLEEELREGDFVAIRIVRAAQIAKAESQGRLVFPTAG